MTDNDSPSATVVIDAGGRFGAPGSASSPHPSAAIPLPPHGFDILDDVAKRDFAVIPAVEAITEAAVMLMSASAEKLGLAQDGEPHLDLGEARLLITALAGLLAASQEHLGAQRQPLRDGLTTLQEAFRAASSFPDEPGRHSGFSRQPCLRWLLR